MDRARQGENLETDFISQHNAGPVHHTAPPAPRTTNRRNEMEIRQGDRVSVNVAPFIGSPHRHRETVPCSVLAIDLPRVQVCPEEPYREISIWVLSDWIEARLEQDAASVSSAPCHSASGRDAEKVARHAPTHSAV